MKSYLIVFLISFIMTTVILNSCIPQTTDAAFSGEPLIIPVQYPVVLVGKIVEKRVEIDGDYFITTVDKYTVPVTKEDSKCINVGDIFILTPEMWKACKPKFSLI